MNDLRNEVLAGLFAQVGRPSEKKITDEVEEVVEETIEEVTGEEEIEEVIEEVVEETIEEVTDNTIINAFTEEQKNILTEVNKEVTTAKYIRDMDEGQIRLLVRSKEKITSQDERDILTYHREVAPDLFCYRWSNLGTITSLDTVKECSVNGIDFEFDTESEVLSLIEVTLKKRMFKHGLKPISSTDLKAYVNVMNTYNKSYVSTAIKEAIKYDGKSTFIDGVKHYMKLVEKAGGTTLDAINLMRFNCNIKKKNLYKDNDPRSTIKHPMFIMLYSNVQGTAKSLLVDKMYMRFGNRFRKMTNGVEETSDVRFKKSMLNSAVTYMDEMHKVNSKGLNAIKTWTTSPTESYRPMGSNDVVTINIKSSFIGSSNVEIGQIIKDPTGMRRFWEFNLRKKITGDYLDQLEKEGYFDKMFSIIDDESFDDEYVKFVDKIAEIQNSYIIKEDKIEEFIEKFSITNSNIDNFNHAIPTRYLYLAFVKYIYENNYTDYLKKNSLLLIEDELVDLIDNDKDSVYFKKLDLLSHSFANKIKKHLKSAGQVLSQYGRVGKYLIECNEDFNDLVGDLPHYMKLKKAGDAKINKTEE